MKNLLFIIALLFISKPDLFAKSCYIKQQFWKTSGLSSCTFGTTSAGTSFDIMHYLEDGEGQCKTRAFVCDPYSDSSIPSGLSNLPDFVQYNKIILRPVDHCR